MRDSKHDRRLEKSLVGRRKVDLESFWAFAGLVCWSGLVLWFSGCNHWEAETPAEVSAMIHVPIWDVWQRVSRRMEGSISD
jgi:hypothetical protein